MSYSKSKLVHVLLKQTVDARNAAHASHRDISNLSEVMIDS